LPFLIFFILVLFLSGFGSVEPLKKKRGVKGVHPMGCLPLWGSKGVTLQTAEKRDLIIGK
jgi:hypothetical protein